PLDLRSLHSFPTRRSSDLALGAIVIHAVWGLLDVEALRRYWRLSRTDCVLALTALLGVLVFDILPGLLLAVVLSLLLLVYRASRDRKSTRLNSSHSQISYA